MLLSTATHYHLFATILLLSSSPRIRLQLYSCLVQFLYLLKPYHSLIKVILFGTPILLVLKETLIRLGIFLCLISQFDLVNPSLLPFFVSVPCLCSSSIICLDQSFHLAYLHDPLWRSSAISSLLVSLQFHLPSTILFFFALKASF